MKNKIITGLLILSLLVSNAAIPVFADNGKDEEAAQQTGAAAAVLPKYADKIDLETSSGENDSTIFTATKKGDEVIPPPVMFAVHFDTDGILENVKRYQFTSNGDTYTATVDKQTGEYKLFIWTGDSISPITTPLTAADRVFGEINYVTAKGQSIGLTGVGNARELGGYATPDGKTVKRGLILRTAALANAADEDIKRLQDVYHLSKVIDLRMTREIDAQPDPEISGAENIWLGIIDEQAIAKKTAELDPSELAGLDLNDSVDRLKIAMKLGIVGDQMYVNFLSGDQGKENYKKMFEELLSLPEGRSLLFHCTQGKDRTGCAAMLILSALGVDEDTIIQDFMLTNTFNAKLIESERKMLIEKGYSGEELQTLMKCMDEVSEQYMHNALDWIKENYGSVTGYITQGLGITDEQIEVLKNKYLE